MKQTSVIAFVTRTLNQWTKQYLQHCVSIFHQHTNERCDPVIAHKIWCYEISSTVLWNIGECSWMNLCKYNPEAISPSLFEEFDFQTCKSITVWALTHSNIYIYKKVCCTPKVMLSCHVLSANGSITQTIHFKVKNNIFNSIRQQGQ